MARAETIETVGEHEVVGNGPVPCHNTCRMEVPRPLHDWPGALITTPRSTRSGSAIVRHRYHHLEPFQVLNLSYPPAFPGLEGREQLRRASTRVTPPPSPGSEQRNRGTDAQRDSSGEPSDSDRDTEIQQDSSRPGPLPDLLPHNEHLSRAAAQLDVSRVAGQLRTIGDEFNAAMLRRAHGAPNWRGWRDVCRELLSFITQTLSTLYRLT
ncbi:bcl-2-binding component 3 isoform X1 [Austrofundulus limnaeus]|uniref:Bcl-2-binding component 3 isoform X1 n=1 Tax=Austrofundulus limnaeus TaxID=52670 RepID=A0A2I4D6G1_AUSLI|nr:PREDICTED: uncharacterized protein LOC106535360 isoform X1 [Austrofundulus limnaeus]